MCGDAGGAVAGVLGVFYQQTPVLSELEAPHAPHELCAARAGVSRPSHSLLQPSTSHPAPPYLFPENMGPKITWRQSHTVSDEVPDRHRLAAALQPPPGPARPPRRPAQPRHRTIPRPSPPLPVPRSPGTRHPLAADPAPPIPAPPAPSGPAPPGTWICPRGRLGEPGCTPGTVRQLMAAQLFTDRPTDRPTHSPRARHRTGQSATASRPWIAAAGQSEQSYPRSADQSGRRRENSHFSPRFRRASCFPGVLRARLWRHRFVRWVRGLSSAPLPGLTRHPAANGRGAAPPSAPTRPGRQWQRSWVVEEKMGRWQDMDLEVRGAGSGRAEASSGAPGPAAPSMQPRVHVPAGAGGAILAQPLVPPYGQRERHPGPHRCDDRRWGGAAGPGGRHRSGHGPNPGLQSSARSCGAAYGLRDDSPPAPQERKRPRLLQKLRCTSPMEMGMGRSSTFIFLRTLKKVGSEHGDWGVRSCLCAYLCCAVQLSRSLSTSMVDTGSA